MILSYVQKGLPTESVFLEASVWVRRFAQILSIPLRMLDAPKGCTYLTFVQLCMVGILSLRLNLSGSYTLNYVCANFTSM